MPQTPESPGGPSELEPGTTLGHYRLESRLGQGGMGVVWKALDTTLGRSVAIKLLPEALARDPERIARLEREARLLASLNHPRIAAIYGIESAGDVRFLVMELVAGETLASRLASGPLAVPEALAAALQIATALEAAHERGIVHRDLKPQNVQVDPDGDVKLLDFGLARAFESDAAGADPATAESPTISARMTGADVILGTAAYMSPEQARGRTVDRRADIWAFGVLLFEMLTGRQLFEGETVTDTLASVLRMDIPWQRLPVGTPSALVGLIRRCLERDARQRLRDIGEARIAIESMRAGAQGDPDVPGAGVRGITATARRDGLRRALLPLAAGLVGGALVAFLAGRAFTPAAPLEAVRKFKLPTTSMAAISEAAIAPDGSAAAYVIGDTLWVAEFTRTTPRLLVVGRGLHAAAWSPDSRAIAYILGTRILSLDIADGTSRTLAETGREFMGGSGMAWSDGGTLIASHASGDGLFEVPEGGGEPQVAVPIDSTQEGDFHDPEPLPGGRGTLAVVHRRKGGVDTIGLFARGKRSVLLRLENQALAHPCYSPSGHLVFERQTAPLGIWAVPFSLAGARTTGKPFLVVANGKSPSVARDGTLLYLSGGEATITQFAWVDRDGKELNRIGQALPRNNLAFGLSSDERRIAASYGDEKNSDIWIIDTGRATHNRLTFDVSFKLQPRWSPSGDRIVYQSTNRVPTDPLGWHCLSRASEGSGDIDTVSGPGRAMPSFTPDGKGVVMVAVGGSGLRAVELVALAGDRTPVLVAGGTGQTYGAEVSPDGRYLAYVDHASGQPEIYLTRFPTGEGRWQISARGGLWPRWSKRGDRLYFVQDEDVMETELTLGESPSLGNPRRLFSRRVVGRFGPFNWTPQFAVSQDGQRFLILVPGGGESGTDGVVVAQNWFSEFSEARPKSRSRR